MPMNLKDYHPDWRSISRQIREQADNRCEFCGIENRRKGKRSLSGVFYATQDVDRIPYSLRRQQFSPHAKTFRIVLTVAHLDQDRANNDPANLRALCQRCHLNWDRQYRAGQPNGPFINTLIDTALTLGGYPS